MCESQEDALEHQLETTQSQKDALKHQLETAQALINKCQHHANVKGIDKLRKKCVAELKYLKRVSNENIFCGVWSGLSLVSSDGT